MLIDCYKDQTFANNYYEGLSKFANAEELTLKHNGTGYQRRLPREGWCQQRRHWCLVDFLLRLDKLMAKTGMLDGAADFERILVNDQILPG